MNASNYNTYEEYLNSFINENDVRYMRNWSLSRKFVQDACGLRCMGQLLSRAEFEDQRRKQEIEAKPSAFTESTLFGHSYKGSDQVLQAFAEREFKLLCKQMSASIDEERVCSSFILFFFFCTQTIVFLLMRSEKGLEVSGYIDLEQSFRESHYQNSLHCVNWPAIFEGKDKLMPRPYHLSFFNWQKNEVLFNNSDNFVVHSEGAHSLLMMHRGNHKIICVNAGCRCNNSRNAKRSIYSSNIYGQCIFFDHIRRKDSPMQS